MILLWMDGGPSQYDTFNPKPGSEFQGPVEAIDTNVPGIRIGELLPRLAKMADKYAVLRSMAHTGGGHPAGRDLEVHRGRSDPDQARPLGRALGVEAVAARAVLQVQRAALVDRRLGDAGGGLRLRGRSQRGVRPAGGAQRQQQEQHRGEAVPAPAGERGEEAAYSRSCHVLAHLIR